MIHRLGFVSLELLLLTAAASICFICVSLYSFKHCANISHSLFSNTTGNGVCEPSAGENLFTCPADGCSCGPDCLSLETTFSSNAGYAYGNIFKVQAKDDLAITSFTIHTQNSGSGTVKIFNRAGEWQDYQYTNSGWNEIMNESFTGNGSGQPTPLAKLSSPVFLSAGEVRSFYFYSSLGVRFLTNAGPLDSIYTQNADLIIHIGKGTGKSALVSFYRMILCIQICSFVDLTTSISNKPNVLILQLFSSSSHEL